MSQKSIEGKLADKLAIPKTQADRILHTFIEVLKEEVAEKKTLSIPGFGVFRVTIQKERTGRDPRNGKPISIPAKNKIKFKAFKGLKEAVN